MANPSDNVVPIGGAPRGRARPSAQESAGMLTDCRDLALERIAGALSGMLDRVEDELFELAEKTREREAQNLYLDARSQARAQRPVIEAAFRRHFVEFFNRAVRGEPGAAPQAAAPAELELVREDELEQSIAVQEMASRLKSACEGELGALSQRLGFLLQKPELADEANPVSPEAVCGALKDACDQIEAGYKVRLTLLRLLENHVAGDLKRVYQDLNQHLVDRQILPDIRPAFRRQAPATAPSRRAEAPVPGAAEGDLYSTLARLMASDAAAGARSPATHAGSILSGHGGAGHGGATGAGDTGGSGVPAATQGFVESLTRLQQPSAAGPDTVNVIRGLKATPSSAGLAPVDAMTIDIVAMLFDYVFDDRQIPPVVKAVLGRLQIPTLKVALLDKAFFSTRAHPARRLLDRLAEASIGLDEKTPRGAATLERIEKVVARVLDEFDTDLALFTALADGMDEFLAEQSKAEEALVERAARVIEEREKVEIARLTAEAAVDGRLAARDWVPEPVRAMLEDAWVRVLARAARDEGEGSARWNAMIATMEELLWSVDAKWGAEDRRRLVNGLPALLRALHDGLALAGIEQPAREAFFGALVDCHADAVKAGLKGIAIRRPVPTAPPAAQPEAQPTIERSVMPSEELDVEEIRLRSPRGKAPVRNVYTRTGIWTNVKRFSWVEFLREGAEPVRARLTWISPAKGVYLFTNPHAKAAISVSPEALAEQMRRGEARLIDDSPLVDRAVDSMLASLRERAA